MIAYIACLRRLAFSPCSMRAFGNEPLWLRGGLMANLLEIAGRETLSQLDYVGSLNIQWWETVRGMSAALPMIGNRHRWRAAVHQMLEIGVDALPMVALMAMCSGFILAMQGASELRRFGALHYVIELVALGFTRELGPLLTAIAVSGRSGSAFAAEIGTMKVTEEIDALKVMAFEPVEFVLAPKYLAALVVVPCLSIVSALFGIVAGGLFMFFSTHLGLVLYFRYVLTSIVVARCDRRDDQECGIRHHHYSCGMPRGTSSARRARRGRSIHNFGGRAINVPGYRRRCDIHYHFLLLRKGLNVHYFGARSRSGIRWPACARWFEF